MPLMSVKVKVKKILIAIVLLTYLKPYNVTLIPSLNRFYSVLKVIATIGLIVYSVRKRLVLSKASRWCMAFVIWWAISIALNRNLTGNIQQLLSIIGMILLFNVMERRKKGLETITKYLRYIAEVYLLLQLYTIVVNHPLIADAVVSYDRYFLGSDNYSAFSIIPLAGFILADISLHEKKLGVKAWFFIVVGFLCLAIPRAWAGVIAYGILIVLLVCEDNTIIKKIATPRNVCILGVVMLVLVMVFHIQDNIGGLLGAMGKVGLNSREIIWPKAVEAVLKRPITGYGMLTEKQIATYILYGASHTHNFILEFLFSSGIIGSCLAFMWIKTSLSVKKSFLKVKAIKYLLYCIVAYFLCGFFDFYISLIYFWTLIIYFDALKIAIQKERIGL